MRKLRVSLAALVVTASTAATATVVIASTAERAAPRAQPHQIIVRSSWGKPTVIFVRSSWGGPRHTA